VIGRADAISEIISLIEPLLERINLQVKINDDLLLRLREYQELVRAYEELVKWYQVIGIDDEPPDGQKLRQRISELRKEIEK